MYSLNPIQERKSQILKGIVDTFHNPNVMIIETPDNPIIDHRQFVSDNIVKGMGGEGSRGGKIIGHTGTGKPIYGDLSAKEHKGFTPQDHRDAADLFHAQGLMGGLAFRLNKHKRDEHHTLAEKGGNSLKDRENKSANSGKTTKETSATKDAKKPDSKEKPEKKDKVEKAFEDELNDGIDGYYATDDRDLIRKGEVLDKLGMGYGGNNAFTFTKTGKELKEILPSTVATLNAKKVALEATMEALIVIAGCDPTEVYCSYSIKNIACKRYPHDDLIRIYDNVSNKYSDMTDEQKAMQLYNDACYAWQSISEDIVTCKVINKNLDDGKKYTLTVSQLIALATGDDDLMKSVEDNLEKQKVAEGSRGGKVIGHTKSGKPIYADQHGSDSSYSDFNSEDHFDAMTSHNKHENSKPAKDQNHINARSHRDIALEKKKAETKLPHEKLSEDARALIYHAGYRNAKDKKEFFDDAHEDYKKEDIDAAKKFHEDHHVHVHVPDPEHDEYKAERKQISFESAKEKSGHHTYKYDGGDDWKGSVAYKPKEEKQKIKKAFDDIMNYDVIDKVFDAIMG